MGSRVFTQLTSTHTMQSLLVLACVLGTVYSANPPLTQGLQSLREPRPSLEHPVPTRAPTQYKEIPDCSANTTKPYCVQDDDYPSYDINAAIVNHKYKFHKLLEIYADVADLNTGNSVERLTTLAEETYLCPSDTAYIMPLRAINTSNKWRVIINGIDVDYDIFTQTTRVEDCSGAGYACPLVAPCYETQCVQKSVFHRFLIFDPSVKPKEFPFAIESFQLNASCACSIGDYSFDH